MNISLGNNVMPQQQAPESADVKRNAPDSVDKISSSTPVQDIQAVDNSGDVAVVQESAQKKVDGEELQNAVIELNKAVQNIQRNLEFSVDDITGRTVVKVVDKQTDEVIRQMPSEEALKLAQHMHEQKADNSGISLMQELKA